MKSKKLLFGLIVAAFVGGTCFASAQTKANYQNQLVEIGPDNIAGRVRAIVVDESDPNHTTLFAGGVAGGLFKKVGDENWQYVPCYINNKELTLPISCMTQLPDNTILIGTGEGIVEMHGYNYDRMSPRGRGVYRFNPEDNSFTLINTTNPATNSAWSYVNRIAVLERDNFYFIYAATNDGLYRWKLNSSNPDWTAAPSLVQNGSFQDVVIISADNIAYASAPGKLYRIGNVTGESAAVDITNSNSAFATSSRIELAANTAHALNPETGTYTHTTYLYAVVVDESGLLDGVFLTNDQQNWNRLTTSTTTPFTAKNPGSLNAAIAINPRNYKQIYVGGATLWQGEGYIANSYYQWIRQSYSEEELNSGNYMASVYADSICLHSGIHQIVSTWVIKNGDTLWTNYYATDGGVYENRNGKMGVYRSLNKGLNTVQYNHIAVAPDGSLIGGAVDNSCTFIQSRNAHNGAVAAGTWYDNNETSIINHMANIIWRGNGGGVEASMFQQLAPLTRRSLFVSCEPGYFECEGSLGMQPVASFARACADYSDFYNTQTWTIADNFLSSDILSSPAIPSFKLWETTNNTIWNDSISFTIDTAHGSIVRHGEVMPLNGNFQIQSGDSILVSSKPQFDYPFYHKFTSSFNVKDKMSHTVHNPVASRAILAGEKADGRGAVYMNLYPNDFRKVYDGNEATSQDDNVLAKLMLWGTLFETDFGYTVGDIAFSRDGLSVYINVYNTTNGKNFLFHIYDFNLADANNQNTMKRQIKWEKDSPINPNNPRITHYDTILASNGSMFNRPMTSIVVDPRDGQDNLILTFGDYVSGEPNMVLVRNASNKATRTIENISVTNAENSMTASDPVYSALIECTTGAVYVGTEKGVFTSASYNNPTWSNYGSFNGVPVTSIIQQTKALQRQSYTVREGVNDVKYLFAKTKYPYAIYFGTYGRGIFMDTSYVVDHVAEVCDSDDWVGITTVDNGENSLSIYPNPAVDNVTIDLSIANAGNATIMIYDVNGKLVHSESMGYLAEGNHQYTLNCSKFVHGMYLVNVNIGKVSATSKLIVR